MLLDNKESQHPQFCGGIRNLKEHAENPVTFFM